jgi:hypothetical protein
MVVAAALWVTLAGVALPASAKALPWIYTPTPTDGPAGEWLTSISAASHNNVWAVGSRAPETAVDQPIAVRWNGHAWASIDVPPMSRGGNLEDVSVVPGTADAWAVGERFGVPTLGLILRWHAGSWTRMDAPWQVAQLYAVQALGPRSAFAAGVSQSGRALVARFDGEAWHAEPGVGQLAKDGIIRSIAARNHHDVWAVGHRWVGNNPYPLLLHFDGVRWERIPPPPVRRAGFLRGVTTVPGTRELWAVGSNVDPWKTMIMYYDGRRWARIRHPEPGGIGGGELHDVIAAGPAKAWAVGQGVTASTLIWNGEEWRETVTPRGDEAGLNGIARAPGTRETFAVGFRRGHTYAVTQR